MKEYRIGDIKSDFWKGLILTVVLALIGGFGMFMLAKYKQSTSYIAQRSVLISHSIDEAKLSESDNQSPVVMTDLNMMQTYTEITQNKQIAQTARKYLSPRIKKNYSADDISQMVNADSHPQSLVMKIKVKSNHEKDSVALVNAVSKGLKKELPSIQPGAGQVHLLAKADENSVISNTMPNKKKYISVGLALGGLLGIVISFIATTWKKYIK